MKDLKDPKHILITGASSGIGAALAQHYAHKGVTLYITARNEARLEAVAQICRDKGAFVNAKIIDVTDRVAMEDFIGEITTLDLVIANAGISGGTGGGDIIGEPFDQARKIFDINLTGVLNTIEPALTKMQEAGQGQGKEKEKEKGQVALISSLAGYRGYPSAPAYSASKGAVRYYGEALRGVYKNTNIAINVICPGFVTSRITDANNFPMPFKMEGHKAAAIIAKGLANNKGRIAFPWPMVLSAWLIGCLPDCLAQIILSKVPAKMAIIKEN